MMEVYSICGGNIDKIYKSGKEFNSEEKRCYKNYCNLEWNQKYFDQIGEKYDIL